MLVILRLFEEFVEPVCEGAGGGLAELRAREDRRGDIADVRGNEVGSSDERAECLSSRRKIDFRVPKVSRVCMVGEGVQSRLLDVECACAAVGIAQR